MIDKDIIERLLQDLESDRVERTVSTTNTDKFGQALCAFANDLHNRYMIINPPKEWQEEGERETAETVQVPYKYRTSSVQVACRLSNS